MWCRSIAAGVMTLALLTTGTDARPPVTMSSSAATRPATRPTSAPTIRLQRDLYRAIAEFEQEHIVQAYLDRGHRDQKWDAAAVELLKTQHEAMAATRSIFLPKPKQPPMSAQDRAKLAGKVIDAGCDDAIVLYMAGQAFGTTEPVRCAEAFAAADKAAAASPYLPVYKLLILEEATKRTDLLEEDDAVPEVDRARRAHLLGQTMADPRTLPANRAVVWELAKAVFEIGDEARADQTATALTKGIDLDQWKPDPWLFATYTGQVEISRGWLARGSGFADTVTAAGWKGLREHLAIARERLEEATKLDPTLPHGPAKLITVSLGESTNDAEKWFDEATRRQVDFYPAYMAYRSHVQPRWGGSVEQQLAFAERALSDADFNTRVPVVAVDIVNDILGDIEQPTPEQLKQLAPLVERGTAGYLARADASDELRTWAGSEGVVWAYLSEDYAKARKILETVPNLDPRPVVRRGLEMLALPGHIYAVTGPQGDAVSNAMDEADPAQRLAMLNDVLTHMDVPPDKSVKTPQARADRYAYHWVKRRIIEATFEASLTSGEWTPLPINTDPKLVYWPVAAGTWRADGDNAIVGVSVPTGLDIVSPFQMPECFEFRCTVEPTSEMPARRKFTYVFPLWSPSGRVGVLINIAEGQGWFMHGSYKGERFPLEREGDRTTVRLRYDNGELIALDEAGTRMAATKIDGPARVRRPSFGEADGATGSGATWRFSDIAVRKLK